MNFASLDFTNAEKNQYKYKLSGYYDEWTLAGSTNSVTFSKLKYGDYQFEVMGTNSDGVWSENTASFNFTIQPHFWQTWWFIPSLVFGFSLIGFLIHLMILKTKVKRVAEIARIR
jgi:hypothetical protein